MTIFDAVSLYFTQFIEQSSVYDEHMQHIFIFVLIAAVAAA